MVLAVLIPIIAVLSVFSFLSVAVYTGHRKEERESYYKNEMLKKLAESSPDSAKSVLEMLREEAVREARQRKEGMRVGGMVTAMVGLALVPFLWMLIGRPFGMIGLIPLGVGIALFIGSTFISQE